MKQQQQRPRPASRPPGPARLLLAAASTALLLGIAGCASTGGAGGSGSDASFADADNALPSPASERVIGGVVEMVLTGQAWPNIEAARENRITEYHDGSPLYV
ncbi:MAG: hypothetical protein AB7O55_26080, partial [Lautropia sp.]